MAPLPTCIAASIGVALLFLDEGAPDEEAAMMEGLVVALDGEGVGGQLLVEELGQVGFLRLSGKALTINIFGTLRLGLRVGGRCGLLLAVATEDGYA